MEFHEGHFAGMPILWWSIWIAVFIWIFLIIYKKSKRVSRKDLLDRRYAKKRNHQKTNQSTKSNK